MASGKITRHINPPNIDAARKVLDCPLNGTIARLPNCEPGWYQIKAINTADSGKCSANMTDYSAANIYAMAYAGDGTYIRALTPWVYWENTTVCARVWATNSNDSGLFYAPPL